MSASKWIKNLALEPHPEGGYYKEVYRNKHTIQKPTGGGTRNLATSIYFLLEKGQKSHFHQLKSDELWYFHQGDPLTIHVFENGSYSKLTLGADNLQVLLPAGSIFGASVEGDGAYCLLGCMVTPGFDFNDFKLFSAKELLEHYPDHEELIREFTINE